MKKFLSSILAMLVVSLSLPHVAWAAGAATPVSGTCGVSTENEGKYVEYEITDENGDEYFDKLTIKLANGVEDAAMSNFIDYSYCPWSFYRTYIQTVEIQDGVTNIGNSAFADMSQLFSVNIPTSVTSIGDSAFNGCSALSNITIPDGVTNIGNYAFYYCSGLNNLTIPDSVTTIGQDAFKYCYALTNVSYLGTDDLYNKGGQNTSVIFTTMPSKVKVPCNYSKATFFTKPVSKEIHDWDDNVETLPATCNATGTKTYTCKNCQETKTETIAVDSSAHTWDDGVLTKEPTTTEKGELTYTCEDCAETKTIEIPELTQEEPEAPTYPEEPETPIYNEHPDWGILEIHAGIKHYVDAEGMTSVEISPENTDENGIVWLREESEGSSAWYGLDNSSGIFEEGSRFYVQWLNESEHSETFEDIDDTTVENVDNGNGWLFEVGVTAPDGTPYKQLEKTIDFYVQIGDDWDREDLDAFYISQDEDEQIPVRYDNIGYPSGIGTFGIMKLSHFSPYFIYDKLSDEEKATFDKLTDEQKAALDSAAKELASQQEEKSTTSAESKPETSSSSSAVKTGDETGYIVLMSSALFIIAGLYIELCMKKKRDQ